MKKILLLLIVGLFAASEDEFLSFAEGFYVQMFSDGEQSAEVKDMYEDFTSQYKSYEDHELYENIDGMYQALGNDESATGYQLAVMKLINN